MPWTLLQVCEFAYKILQNFLIWHLSLVWLFLWQNEHAHITLVSIWTIGITFLASKKLVFPLLRVVDSLRYPRAFLSLVDFHLLMISFKTLFPGWKISFLKEAYFFVVKCLEIEYYFSKVKIYAHSLKTDFFQDNLFSLLLTYPTQFLVIHMH